VAEAPDEATRDLLARVLMQAADYDAAAEQYRALERPDSEALAYVLGHRLEDARALAARHPLRDAVLRAIEVAPFTTGYRLKTVREHMAAERWSQALLELEDMVGGLKTPPGEEMLALRRTCRERLGMSTD
jgi:hypothetical protein